MTFKSLSKIRSVGGSLVVTIPKEIVREKCLNEGEVVELEIEKPKKNFFGALRGIGAFSHEDRMKDRDL